MAPSPRDKPQHRRTGTRQLRRSQKMNVRAVGARRVTEVHLPRRQFGSASVYSCGERYYGSGGDGSDGPAVRGYGQARCRGCSIRRRRGQKHNTEQASLERAPQAEFAVLGLGTQAVTRPNTSRRRPPGKELTLLGSNGRSLCLHLSR
jgi:hypothetical protein